MPTYERPSKSDGLFAYFSPPCGGEAEATCAISIYPDAKCAMKAGKLTRFRLRVVKQILCDVMRTRKYGLTEPYFAAPLFRGSVGPIQHSIEIKETKPKASLTASEPLTFNHTLTLRCQYNGSDVEEPQDGPHDESRKIHCLHGILHVESHAVD